MLHLGFHEGILLTGPLPANVRHISREIKIVDQLRKIPQHQSEMSAMRFLDIVERIIRRYHFRPYDADKRGRLAECRYPKRVYDDTALNGVPDSFKPSLEPVDRHAVSTDGAGW